MLRTEIFSPPTPKTVVDPAKLREILDQAKRDGYAIERNQTDLGVTCVAVPVYWQQEVIAAISVKRANRARRSAAREAVGGVASERGQKDGKVIEQRKEGIGMSDVEITLDMMRKELYSAVLCDALDGLGYRNQSPRVQLPRWSGAEKLVGRCKTTLWVDMAHADPKPYELELQAVDNCRPDDVLIAAAGGSMRSGIWGELLSTAAHNSGCVGTIVDGAVRDIAKMRSMGFTTFARARASTTASTGSVWSMSIFRWRSTAFVSIPAIWFWRMWMAWSSCRRKSRSRRCRRLGKGSRGKHYPRCHQGWNEGRRGL